VEFTPQGGGVYKGKGAEPALPLKGKITLDQVNKLLAEFRGIGFYSLQKRYGSAAKYKRSSSCPEIWTDSPSATVSVVERGKHKAVSHYLGCNGTKTLDDLTALERKIDEIANAEQWTSQYGWGTGNVIDLKIQVNHSNSTAAKKPQD
jgi:hypothetical protein